MLKDSARAIGDQAEAPGRVPSILTGWQLAVSPKLGMTLLGMGMTIIVILLMSLPFTDRTSPQFVVGSISLLTITEFTLLVAWDVRRQVREE